MKRQTKRGRVVAQTEFDRQLIRLESVVSEFSGWLDEVARSPADRESIEARLWAIRLNQFPQVVHSLKSAMEKAMKRAFPMDAENGM